MSSKEKTFEDSLEELKDIVKNIDKEDISLDESIKLYEKGLNAYYECTSKMSKLEQTIEVLVEKNGEFLKEELDEF